MAFIKIKTLGLIMLFSVMVVVCWFSFYRVFKIHFRSSDIYISIYIDIWRERGDDKQLEMNVHVYSDIRYLIAILLHFRIFKLVILIVPLAHLIINFCYLNCPACAFDHILCRQTVQNRIC